MLHGCWIFVFYKLKARPPNLQKDDDSLYCKPVIFLRFSRSSYFSPFAFSFSLTNPALLLEESLLWLHTHNPSQKSLCLKSPNHSLYPSYNLELPTLYQLLGYAPRYPSQAEILVDRIHGLQQLFPKYIGTLSPRIVLRPKKKEGGWWCRKPMVK